MSRPDPGPSADSQSPTIALPPALAGRYEYVAELGRGGMGTVWRANDTVIGRQVAVKQLRPPRDLDERDTAGYEQRVLREARAAGRISDPGIVTVHDVVTVDGTVYIVMELVEAPDLGRLVKEHGPLGVPRVAEVGRQVLGALEAAHRFGIVHRDVKPSNILVTDEGRAKLTDFGIARSSDEPDLTRTGVLMGSPAYLSPERLAGQPATPASDLWALGAVLYYAVEGRPAFDRGTTPATLHAIATEIPYLTQCQGPLAAAILGLLVHEPAGRLTVAQVRPLLDAAAASPENGDQESATATAVYTTGFTQKMPTPQTSSPPAEMSRKARWAAVPAIAAALLGGGIFIGTRIADRPVPAPDASEPTPSVAVFRYGTGGDVDPFGLGTGDCSDTPLKPGYQYPQGSSCTDPHVFEVYYTFNPVSDTDNPITPDDRQLVAAAEAQCRMYAETAEMADYLKGIDVVQPAYAAIVPTTQAFTTKGSDGNYTRDVHCVVWDGSGKQMPPAASPTPS